jgi:hypothetical protein
MPPRAAVVRLVVEVHRTFWTCALLDATMVASGQLIYAQGRQSSNRILSKDSLFAGHRRCERLYAFCGARSTIDDVEVLGLGFGA